MSRKIHKSRIKDGDDMDNQTEISALSFSEKVKWVRGQLLLTQEQLAAEIGVTPSTVSRWENTERKPSFLGEKQFERFCEKKGIKI